MRDITHIVMHCTATRAKADIGVAEVDRWHRAKGWAGVGYHFIIRRNGEVERGRPIERKGAHVRGFNASSIGVSLAGGVASDGQTPEDNFTDRQMIAACDLVLDLMAMYHITVDKVLGHREVIQRITHDSPKACPVFSMHRFRTMVKERQYSGEDDSTGINWGMDMADDDEETTERNYTVRSGDTLWGIANREGTTIADIRRLNPTIPVLIRPGDVIRL